MANKRKVHTFSCIHRDDFLNVVINHNIVGYHTVSDGRTFCLIENRPADVKRVDFEAIRCVTHRLSVSQLKSPASLLRWFIGRKLVRGVDHTYHRNETISDRNNYSQIWLDSGHSVLENIFRMPSFKKWRQNLKSQIKLILNDKAQFKIDSTLQESIDSIKNALVYVQNKHKWDTSTLKDVIDTAYDQYSIESAMEI